MWDELKEKSWTGEDIILTKDDLGLSADSFVYTKETMKAMDWDAML